MPNAKRTGLFTAGIVAALLLAVFAIVILNQAEKSRADIPVIAQMPDFEFVNQDGQPWGSAQMRGKISVLDFVFTRCKTACPVMSTEMSKLYKAFDGSNDVQFVSVTVDPEYDSLAVLKGYAVAHGVTDDRWQFLHAPLDSVVKLSEEGFMLPADNLPMGHSPRFVLIDREGRIRGYFNALEGKPMIALREQMTQLLKEAPGGKPGLVSSAHAAE